MATMDEEQHACVYNTAANLLIVAGPGSGKTRTVAEKCAKLVESGVEPQTIICITFTNKAADELKHRINIDGVRVGTYHSIALATLRDYKVGMFGGEFTILTNNSEPLKVMKAFLGKYNFTAHVSAVHQLYHKHRLYVDGSAHHREGIHQPDGTTVVPASVVAECFDAYERHKQQHALADYDDLLHTWLTFLREQSGDTVRYVFADEVQDSNDVQNEILKAFAVRGASVIAVGDPDQSIYGFRGSNMQHILNFARVVPGTEQLTLQRNYRSTPQITRVCEQIIQYNHRRIHKGIQATCENGPPVALYPFETGGDEQQFVATVCEKALEAGQECAILVRTNREVDALESLMYRRRIPYALLKGSKLLDRMHVKQQLLTYKFVFMADPPEEVVVNFLEMHKGVGKQTAAKLATLLLKDTVEDSVVAVFMKLTTLKIPNILQPFHAALNRSSAAVLDIHAKRGSAYGAFGSQLASICVQHILTICNLNADQQADINAMETIRNRYETFDALLDAICLGTVDMGDTCTALIKLGTIHQAKGLEFDSCVVCGCVDGSIPNGQSMSTLAEIEEERRLLFVAASRAKYQLCFTFAHEGTKRLSQFLRPLLDNLVVKQNSHLVLTLDEPLPSPADVDAVACRFMRAFGRYNKLFAELVAAVNFERVDVGLEGCANAAQKVSAFAPKAEVALLFKRLVLAMVRNPALEWQDVVDEEVARVYLGDTLEASRRSRLLRGTQLDGTLPKSTWPHYLDSLQLLVDRLLAANPQRIAVSRKLFTADKNFFTQVDLVLDTSLFAFCFSSASAAPPPESVTTLMSQALIANQNSNYNIKTLVVINLFNGVAWRAPYARVHSISVPPAMQQHVFYSLC
jgi:DNA helicase-2/ATP-dependent DNA helicase PcrA